MTAPPYVDSPEIGKSQVDFNLSISECQGSRRFSRMKRAVLDGENAPPVDLRYLRKPCSDNKNQSQRSSVISFLASLYESVAETLPDFRDEVDTGIEIAGLDQEDEMDPYATLLGKGHFPSSSSSSKPEDKSKTRLMSKSVKVNLERKPSHGGPEVRFLPPGQMKDMWEQYRQTLKGSCSKPASFATFWRDTCHLLVHVFFLQESLPPSLL